MLKIVAVSDVTLGFGSPQIPNFVKFLKTHYTNSAAVVIEPDQLKNEYAKDRHSEFELVRVPTFANVHSKLGRIEYLNSVVPLVNKYRPDILVIFCTFTLPILLRLKSRPTFTIYYNIEMASYYGSMDDFLNTSLSDRIDLLIYPEKNRAMLDINKYGDRGIPTAVVVNAESDVTNDLELSLNERSLKIIYQGTIDAVNTNAGYFLDELFEEYRIDLYGNFSGAEAGNLRSEFLKLNRKVRYIGYVESHILKEIRKKYAYSIVMWAPVNENQYYAAPNKFFEALADGIPPISAPHPQCEYFIKKYNCGILMEDWSKESLAKAIEIAINMYGTPAYKKMVENCIKATEKEATWQIQMDKVKPYLKDIGADL